MPNDMSAEASLEAILAAREARARKQRTLLAANPGLPLICLTVNMPGPDKRTAESGRVFAAGLKALQAALTRAHIAALHCETACADAGYEAYIVPDADAETLKRLACELEASLPYGRLLDVDVHRPDGTQLSRADLSLPERGCMVCGKPGAGCASRRLHPLPILLEAFRRLADTAPEETL